MNIAIRTLTAEPSFKGRLKVAGYFRSDSAAIFSITIALEPPRSYVFPLAVTLCPAKGSRRSFWPDDGVVSAIGQ
jgi:hypothetical protein